jgi:hypothetical protein
LTTVGNSAFAGATSLKTIDLGPTTSVLGDSVFKDCTSLSKMVLPETLTTMGNKVFDNCTSLSSLVFPPSLSSITGTDILIGATGLRSLTMHKDLWTNAVRPSLVENIAGFAQLVEFYHSLDFVKKYPDILEHYRLMKNSFSVDWSNGGVLAKITSSGLIYDGSLLASTTSGTFDGVLTILGTGELSPSLVTAGIRAHHLAQDGLRPLHTLLVGPDFTSLNASLSLGSITSLHFPAASPMTKSGRFVLSTEADQPVVLPQWVINGPE